MTQQDAAAGKLDALAAKALANFRSGFALASLASVEALTVNVGDHMGASR